MMRIITPPFPKYKVQMRHYLLAYYFASENIPLSKCKVQFQHYLLGLFYALEKKYLSKCKVQMRHYLLGLFYALENNQSLPPSFLNTKCKSDIIYKGY
jgi:hypothetical protein